MRKSLSNFFAEFSITKSKDWQKDVESLVNIITSDKGIKDFAELLGPGCTLERAYQFAIIFCKEFMDCELRSVAPSMMEERRQLAAKKYVRWQAAKEANRRQREEEERKVDIHLYQNERKVSQSLHV